MVGFVLKRLLFPAILWFLVVALSNTLIPADYAPLRPLPAIVFLIGLMYWWVTGLARWLVRRWKWVTVGYLMTNLAMAFVLLGSFGVASYALTSYDPQLATLAGIAGFVAGAGWLLWSIVHLLRHGQRRRSKSIWWRLLGAWLDQAETPAPKPSASKPQPAKRQTPVKEAPRTPTRTNASTTVYGAPTPKAPAKSAPKAPASKPLFTQVGAGGDAASVPGLAIPPRPSTTQADAPRPSTARMVGNDSQAFFQQAQEWALRQEYVGNYVPFEASAPTYDQMSFEQQQWYFYWRTQVRQGKFLATDLSYLFVYVYELLNLVGVQSPVDARNRLVTFWQTYRPLQPKLDNSLVDWVADFGVLNQLPESVLAWYAETLRVGASSRHAETLQLEAWHQQGRNYERLPATTLYALADYAAQQSKFYQAFLHELALDDSLKRGVAVVDQFVQQSQKLSLYELHLPLPAQTVVRLPLQGAVHQYPSTPIVIGRVRPWMTKDTLRGDLKSILRYTENILRTQAGYKTKLRGVTLPPAWASVLDQAFVKVPPKRVVSIDLAGAAALQRESDELRQRLLDAVETPPTEPVTLQPPIVESAIPATSPSNASKFQRPQDAPEGALTDLAALAAVMGDAHSEATALLRALATAQWQSKPANLKTTSTNSFMSLLFDQVNERALTELGDALIFMEGDEWVVAEDYRDEIRYLLDHPDFATKLVPDSGVSAAAHATSSAGEAHDLIPAGWEECVRQMSPLHWATLAVVLEAPATEVMSQLDQLARTHFVTASQLLDQVNEVGLASVGDNVVDVASTPPQVIEEYSEPLKALLLWAKEHGQIDSQIDSQIEGLP